MIVRKAVVVVPGVSSSERIFVTDPTAPTILLIDDNDNDRTYYAERLKIGLPDCHVLEAKDGRSGLDLYHSRRIDCIVTELYLPDMSGYELLVEVVPHPSKPTTAVIMLTRAVWRNLNELALQHGAHAFLVKRFTSGDELGLIIQKAMARVGPIRKDRRE